MKTGFMKGKLTAVNQTLKWMCLSQAALRMPAIGGVRCPESLSG
jgi:hypothetical protein